MNTPLEERLRTELDEEATAIELRPGYVATTVATVLARRRRRQLGVAATSVAVAVLTVGGVAVGTGVDNTAQAPANNPTPSAPEPNPQDPPIDFDDIQRIPPERSWDALPWRDTGLPRVLPSDVATAPAMSQDPIDHALALVAGPGPMVGVIGDDGGLRRLDGVTLEPARDPSGYRSSPVQHGSLTADGRLAAFPQPDAVVVVDLASGSIDRFDVPGLNTRVLWHPDQHVILVGREGGPSSLLDIVDGTVEDAPYNAYNTAYAPDGTAFELTRREGVGPPVLVRWENGTEQARVELSDLGHSGETPPEVTGSALVFAGAVDDVDPRPQLSRTGEGWIVVDLETSEPISMLRMPEAWYRGWLFGPCVWLNDDTVLLMAERGLVAWTPDTGALERVAETDTYQNLSLATDPLD